VQPKDFDIICLGSGPAGQKAAIQAAKAGFSACIVEREPLVGGSCLLSGTIPSKALREQAVRYRRMQGSASSLAVELRGDAPLSALLHGVDVVIAAQDRYLLAQLKRNSVELIRGKGVFLDAHRIEVQHLDGSRSLLQAPRVLLATGSRPRHVAAIEVDHEHVVDSDSILSLPYIPRSMLVLGSGVIACEYASIFAALGCRVTMLDKAAEPLGFLDAPLRAGFLSAFRAMGGEYRAGVEVESARFDGFSQVEVTLRGSGSSAEVIAADIVFAAFGRVANLEGIGLDALKLGISQRGTVQVSERFETNLPGVFATSLVPSGVYTIPEIACVGLSQSEAATKKIEIIAGRADFSEVARAHIAGEPTGFLTLLCERNTARVLGVQVLGEGATDLVHLGQAAIAAGATADFFIEQIFNFPTMTEAYRIAAFDILKQRPQAQAATLRIAGAAR
jgi:NAD(P) transhydrogenase